MRLLELGRRTFSCCCSVGECDREIGSEWVSSFANKMRCLRLERNRHAATIHQRQQTNRAQTRPIEQQQNRLKKRDTLKVESNESALLPSHVKQDQGHTALPAEYNARPLFLPCSRIDPVRASARCRSGKQRRIFARVHTITTVFVARQQDNGQRRRKGREIEGTGE